MTVRYIDITFDSCMLGGLADHMHLSPSEPSK
jgi:hypothetical protein